MCGIMFKTNYYSKTLHDSFNKAVNSIAHRGPDEEGILYTKVIPLVTEDYQSETLVRVISR